MYRNRIIPALLLKEKYLVKTVKFGKETYIGDPINAVKIFNDKEVDELIFVDIDATKEKRAPNYELLGKIAREAFMPLGYGGGLRNMEQITRIFSLGFEKVALDTAALRTPGLVRAAANKYGEQSIVGVVNVKRNFFGKYKIYGHVKKKLLGMSPVSYARKLTSLGCGEILINDVDRDGVMQGYDTKLIRQVSRSVQVPVVALGGAGSKKDLDTAVQAGASAAAAGSLFVFYGPHRAVLINYPTNSN